MLVFITKHSKLVQRMGTTEANHRLTCNTSKLLRQMSIISLEKILISLKLFQIFRHLLSLVIRRSENLLLSKECSEAKTLTKIDSTIAQMISFRRK